MKLLVTAPWPDAYLDGLRAEFSGIQFVNGRGHDAEMAAVGEAEIVIGYLSREGYLAARQLRWIQCQGAGVEFIGKIPELIESDVVVTNTSGAHAATIAEHTFGMLIFLTRGFGPLIAAQARHEWQRPLTFRPVGLAGLTLGVIGLGNIGRAIAKRGAAFEMDVIAVDAFDVPKPEYVRAVRGLDGLPDLLRQANAVVVATPLTDETRGMLGPEQLALMKPSAYLLAISRGGIVNDRAVAAMLTAGTLAGAGLDVQEQEPLPADHPLWDAPNLILTPHSSGQSTLTTEIGVSIIRDNLKRYLAGEPLTHVVDKRRGF